MGKGDKIEFNFHGFGLISKEEAIVYDITDEYIQIDAEEEEKYRYKFSLKNGRCLNDNTDMGCKRTFDINTLK